ncbi:Epimerase family protein [Mycobacteroides abscessus subsp. massiliense]|nr:Epimerase family protein [Mycobacteroides abscessus subsp. massiliense]
MLAGAVADAGVPALINASAVGYYGDSGDRVIDETASSGTGFLARVCIDWEAATEEAVQAGTRVVIVRTGRCSPPPEGSSADHARFSPRVNRRSRDRSISPARHR